MITESGQPPLKANNQSYGSDSSPALEKTPSAQEVEYFNRALENHKIQTTSTPFPLQPSDTKSIGVNMLNNLSSLGSKLKSDHNKLSKLIEKAVTSGNSNDLIFANIKMKEHFEANQICSKIISKAAQGLSELVKLQ